MNVFQLLNQKPIIFHPIYKKITDSTTAGLLLSHIMYWLTETRQNEVVKTNEEIKKETALTSNELRGAKLKLKALPFLEITTNGSPPVTVYKIDWDKAERFLTQFGETIDDTSPSVAPRCNTGAFMPDWFAPKDWADLMEHRRKKGAIQSERALKVLRDELNKAHERLGLDSKAITDEITNRGWRGFKAEWLERDMGNLRKPRTVWEAKALRDEEMAKFHLQNMRKLKQLQNGGGEDG